MGFREKKRQKDRKTKTELAKYIIERERGKSTKKKVNNWFYGLFSEFFYFFFFC